MDRIKIAIVVSHPIQHFCPQYASFAKNESVNLKVFFASTLGKEKYFDFNFKREIAWGNLYLDHFDHQFLNTEALKSDSNLDAPQLNAALDQFNPEIVVVYGYFQKLQRRAHQWAVKTKKKIAYISDSELRHKRNWWKQLLKYPIISNYFSKIDYFLSVGDANEQFYQHYGVESKKMLPMHFPIDLALFEDSFSNRNLLANEKRNQWEIHPEELVLTTVGKLVPWKNQNHIIDALAILEKESIFAHLFIIGSGEMQGAWEKKASELKRSKVHFPGFVAPEELPGYYAAADIYVHAASLEPHSIAISEAIYMACPVIISDRCGSYGDHDDVQLEKNGLVFEFGNARELADRIRVLLTDEDKRRRFSEHSISISRQFQQRAHVDIIDELVARLNGKLK